MKYQIEQQGHKVVIHFAELDGQEQTVIEAIRRCRQSAWACPSGECMQIAELETNSDQQGVCITMTPRPDVELNLASIRECLAYQLPKAAKV